MIYERLPQSLKQDESLRDGSIIEGLETTVFNSSTSIRVSPGKIYWDSPGVVEVPEIRISLEVLPGEYVLVLGNRPQEPSSLLPLSSEPVTDYRVTLKGYFKDPGSRPENLYADDGVYTPGVPNAALTLEAKDSGYFTSVEFDSTGDVVIEGVTQSPFDGRISYPVGNLPKVNMVVPDADTQIGNLRVSGMLEPSSSNLLEPSSNLSIFLQPTGRELVEDIPESRVSLALLKYKKDKTVQVLRSLGNRDYQLDITKYITSYWDKNLEAVYKTMYYYIPDYLNPLTAYKVEYDNI